MNNFPFVNITRDDFEKSEAIYRIIEHNDSSFFGFFALAGIKYYLGWISPSPIKVEFKSLETENYLLIGVDLKVVVLCLNTGKILFSIGLFSYFKGFENTNELAFTIFTEVEDIRINKNGLSISQIIPHDLDF